MKELSVPFPISQVTVYPAAARICRKAIVSLDAGECKIVASNLPGTLSSESVRVEIPADCGLIITGVTSRPRTQAKREDHEYTIMENKLKELIVEKVKLEAEIQNADNEIGLFFNKAGVSEQFYKERFLSINVENWKEFYPFLQTRFLENRNKARDLVFKKLELEVKIEAAQRNLASRTGSPEQIAEIEILCEAAAKKEYPVQLYYLQNNVSWYPVYTVSADISQQAVTVAMSAVIYQATKEDWHDVTMLLSTAHPLFSCSIPKLSSKRLREQDAEVEIQKKPQPIAQPPAMPHMEMMKPEAEPLMSAQEPMRAKKRKGLGGFLRKEGKKESKMRSIQAHKDAKLDYMEMMQPEEEQMIESEEYADEIYDQSTVRQSDSKAPSGVKRTRPRFHLARPPYLEDLKNIDMAEIMQHPLPTTLSGNVLPQWCADGISPEQSLGGYDYRYPVHGLRSISSSNISQRIPVAQKELPMECNYLCVPSEKEAVYMNAKFANDKETPLPAGPAQVFADQSLLGSLAFTTLGPGEKGQVSLGIDKDIKVLRRENRFRRRKGIVSKDAVNDYTIEIELISFKKETVSVMIIDRYPESGNEKEIAISDFTSLPKPKIRSNQILEWNIDLPPQQKKIIKFSYSIKHPENYRLVMSEHYSPFDPQREV